MLTIPDQVLIVKEGEVYACIDIMHIEKISLLPKIIYTPEMKAGLIGLVIYKNMSLPVYDLSVLANYKRDTPYTVDNLIIIIHAKDGYIALLVDTVIDIYKTNAADSIDRTNSTAGSLCFAYMTLRGSVYSMIDVNKVMQS